MSPKKRGSEKHTTHLLSPTNLVVHALLIFFTHTELQFFSHSIYWLARSSTPHRLKICKHNNTTDLRYSSSASPIHTCIRQRNFLIAFTHYVQSPKAQAFLTSEGSQNNSSSAVLTFFPFLSLVFLQQQQQSDWLPGTAESQAFNQNRLTTELLTILMSIRLPNFYLSSF